MCLTTSLCYNAFENSAQHEPYYSYIHSGLNQDFELFFCCNMEALLKYDYCIRVTEYSIRVAN